MTRKMTERKGSSRAPPGSAPREIIRRAYPPRRWGEYGHADCCLSSLKPSGLNPLIDCIPN